MPRRFAPADYFFHVINRAIEGTQLFETPDDYRAFERLLAEAHKKVPIRIFLWASASRRS